MSTPTALTLFAPQTEAPFDESSNPFIEEDCSPDELPDWTWVAASPFRAHVERVLAEEPLPWRAFAGYAGVPDNVLRALLGIGGRRRPHRLAPHYARALISTDAATLRCDLTVRVPGLWAAQAVRRLIRMGCPMSWVAMLGDLPTAAVTTLLGDRVPGVTRRQELLLAAAVRAHGLADEELLDAPVDERAAA